MEKATRWKIIDQCRWEFQRGEYGNGGTGVVIRDSNGSFIAGSYTYLEHTVDAPTAEVMALRDGLLLAQHIGCNGFTLQSDCLEVVEAIMLGYSAAAGAPIFYDCFLLW
jgi:ribonuclease HI